MKERAPTVFIVDDDDGVRASLRILLKSVGLPAAPFSSVQEFLANYHSSQPGTVEIHRAHVMEKMEAGSVAQLVRMVMDIEHAGRDAPRT